MNTLRALPPPPPLTKGRILLVDDDERLRRAYGIMLRRASFIVVEAADGCVAAEKLATEVFDLVISDIRLPDTTGLDLMRTVRAVDADLPVVLMTAGADVPTAIEAVEAKALRYLLKPVEREVLCATAEDGLKERAKARVRRDAFAQYVFRAKARQDAGERVEQAVASLEMAYQPIVRLSTHEVLAYEALVRPSVRNLESPEALFREAELATRLPDVGRRIRGVVAEKLTATAHAPQQVFVNLHPLDLFDDQLFEPSAPLSQHASRVTLEITERASLESISDVKKRVDDLRTLGFRIAIDDLGSGYAGLSALTDLRPDVVKLAMSFTRGIDQDSTKRKLIRALVSVCDEMNALLVVEGIETPDVLNAFADLGADIFQGWLFGRPARSLFPAVDWSRV